jgi:two-component system, OmpR family, phosphate regulon response regulator OmpR
MVANARILVVDDDERLADMLGTYLRSRGFDVELRADGSSGLRALEASRFDLVVLDVMLPDIDGLEVLRRLRATSNNVPVLMLTARGEDTDRIVGLELGADDYLPKPFNPREVVARLTAILRRGRVIAVAQGDVLRFGKLEVDRAAHEARVSGKPCLLTAHQFEILRVLAERAGRVQTRDQLMQAVRGEDLEEFDRSIDVHISRIRAAIEDDPKHPKRIRTVRAVGYVFAPLAEDQQ